MESHSLLDIQIAERDIGDSIAISLLDCFQELGHRAELITDNNSSDLREGVLLVLGNMIWFPNLRRRLQLTSRQRRPFVMVWHYEPLPPPRAAKLPRPCLSIREIVKIMLRDRRVTDVYSNFIALRHLHRRGIVDQLVVTTRGRQEFLAEQGIPSVWIPLGYQTSRGRPLGLDRDIDVLFLGTMDVPRRRKIIKRLKLLGMGVLVRGDWKDPACWGEARTQLLNRTKILLNFPRTAGEMSGVRFILGMCNRALVVSEPVYRPDPYIPGVHFISSAIEQIPETVAHFLSHEQARTAITETAYDHLLRDVRLDQSAIALLRLMRQPAP